MYVLICFVAVSQLVFNVRDHYRFSDKRHKEDLLDLLCIRRLVSDTGFTAASRHDDLPCTPVMQCFAVALSTAFQHLV
jgi:hypothetical protein